MQADRGAQFNWNGTDELVGGAATAGIEVLPFLTGAPNWAVKSVVVNGAAHVKAPRNLPVRNGTQKSGWKNFLSEVVHRYGPGGGFWAANPAIPYRPIRSGSSGTSPTSNTSWRGPTRPNTGS